MISTSRLIVGLVLLIGGIILTVVCLVSFAWGLFYAVPAIIIGIFVLLNKNEDKIEERQDLNKRNDKK